MSAPHRSVTLRYRGQDGAGLRPDMDAAQVEQLQREAERHGLPRHPDPQFAALLAAVRIREDVPPALYAAVASVLAQVYAAAERTR